MNNSNPELEGFYNLDKNGKRKYLFINHIDGKFDWGMVWAYLIGSIVSSLIFMSSTLTFTLSRAAGLNSGIAISIWALLPVFAAVIEYFTYKTPLRIHQLIGILVMFVGAAMVSCSDIVNKNKPADDVAS